MDKLDKLKLIRTTARLELATPLILAAKAARTCWRSGDKSDTLKMMMCSNCHSLDIEDNECGQCGSMSTESHIGDKDMALLLRMLQFKHESIFEHIIYHITVRKMTRASLQEKSRHRIGISPSVESSRYVLKKLLKGMSPDEYPEYFHFTGDKEVDSLLIQQIEILIEALKLGKSNDDIKHLLPEAMYCDASYTINLRALRNLVKLRTAKGVYPPMAYQVSRMLDVIPKKHLVLIEDCIGVGYIQPNEYAQAVT